MSYDSIKRCDAMYLADQKLCVGKTKTKQQSDFLFRLIFVVPRKAYTITKWSWCWWRMINKKEQRPNERQRRRSNLDNISSVFLALCYTLSLASNCRARSHRLRGLIKYVSNLVCGNISSLCICFCFSVLR